jgi:hypothetical protein
MRQLSPRFTSLTILLVGGALAISLLVGGCVLTVPRPTPALFDSPAVTLPPSATASPVPTSTPTPTQTSTPTPSPTPTRTATPDRSATAAVAATQWADAAWATVQADLKPIDKIPRDGRLGWMQEFPIFIEISGHDEATFSPFPEDLVAADFILKTDITWDSTEGYATCGFVFRYDPESRRGGQYQFAMTRFSGLPAWEIFYNEYNRTPVEITGLRTSGAIDQRPGATNRLILLAQEDRFTLYANGRKLGTFYDHGDFQQEGVFAFSASHDSGLTTCTYENTWVWLLGEQ